MKAYRCRVPSCMRKRQSNMTKTIIKTIKMPPTPEATYKGIVQEDSIENTKELTPKDQKEVRVIERVIENREITPADAFGKLTRNQVELIKRTVAKGATDDELKMFIQVCKGTQLNPFLRQVHFVKRWSSAEAREVGAIQVGIDGFRSIAESTGSYAGNDDPVYDGEKELPLTDKKDAKKVILVPLKATVTVYKFLESQRMAFTATARWDEYYPGPRLGFQWHIRPYLMLGKCAEALALRKAFPKLLSGMYAQEEMDRGQAEADDAQKTQKAKNYIQDAIGKSSLKELEELRGLIEKSDKYDKAQKEEFLKMVDDKITELKTKQPPAGPAQPEVPTVQVGE